MKRSPKRKKTKRSLKHHREKGANDADQDARCEDWLHANPHAFRKFVEIALQYRQTTGESKWSAEGIYQRMRWVEKIELRRTDEYRLNDHWRSRLSRLAMHAEPELAGFFETRGAKCSCHWTAADMDRILGEIGYHQVELAK